jgi:hypothetical protein
MASFEREQAAVIRTALSQGRKLSAFSVTLSVAGDRRIAIVFTVTERAAKTLASTLGGVVRVGLAHVRNFDAAIARALGAVPAATQAPAAPPSERERARDYLRGVAARPSDDAVYAVLGRAVHKRAPGEPKRGPAVYTGRLIGEPIVGEYTLTGGRRAA